MWVKICANTNLADAQLAAALGADAVGFVFAPSKRQVTAEQVAAITPHLPATLAKVGVFTVTDAEQILATASLAGLTHVQLHSAFDPQLVDVIAAGSGGSLKVLQVVDVPAEMEPEDLRAELNGALAHPSVSVVLLDAAHGGASGGTGKAFDWKRTAEIVREVQRADAKGAADGKILIAGGLTAENVVEAIVAFAPWGVDVASGVEASAGIKDATKLRDFLLAARAAAPS